MDKELILEQIRAMNMNDLRMRIQSLQKEIQDLSDTYNMIDKELQTRRDRGLHKEGGILCSECNGSGGGMGYNPYSESGFPEEWVECENCDGKGYVEYLCPFCKEPNEKDEPGNCDMCSILGPSGI